MHRTFPSPSEDDGPSSGASTVVTPARTRIGPSMYFLPGAIATSPLFWAWIALAAFRYSSFVRYWVWRAAFVPPIQKQIIASYSWLKAHEVGTWLVYGALALLAYGLIRYSTTSFSITAEGDLVVNTGLLGMKTPRGPFIAYENTVSHIMITDADVSRNIVQLFFGTGTLVVTFTEPTNMGATSRTILLPFMKHPRQYVDLLMAKSGLKSARFIV